MARTKELHRWGARDDIAQQSLPAEVCERMKRDGGPVFPAHAKTGHPHGPFRGLPANENARALISMVARSTAPIRGRIH